MSAREPAFFSELRTRLVGADIRAAGVAENWVAPSAVYDAPAGFGEETWFVSTDNVIAWRGAGPEIECHGGPRRGSSAPANQRLVTLHVQGTENRYRATSKIRFGQFIIPDDLLTRVACELGFSGPPKNIVRDDLVFFSDHALFGALEDYASRAVSTDPCPSRIEMEARALLIVERLLNVHHRPRPLQRGGLPPYVLRRLTDYIQTHLAEDVSLAELAALADLSPYHFCRAFKQSTGLPPHAWLTARRIERAQELMTAHPRMGLTEVALGVGYDSQAAFGAAFKRATGATPGQWRRERAGCVPQ